MLEDVVVLGSEDSELPDTDDELLALCDPRLALNKGHAKESNKRPNNDHSETDEEQEQCPICLEPWTNAGPHRIVSLACGHLFGMQCIDRWLRKPPSATSSANGTECPTCKSPARAKDLRPLFATRIRLMDALERERWQADLAAERAKRERAEVGEARATQQLQLLLQSKNHVVSALAPMSVLEPISKDPIKLIRKLPIANARWAVIDSFDGSLLVGRSAPVPSANTPSGWMRVSLWDQRGAPLHTSISTLKGGCFPVLKAAACSPFKDSLVAIAGLDGFIGVWNHSVQGSLPLLAFYAEMFRTCTSVIWEKRSLLILSGESIEGVALRCRLDLARSSAAEHALEVIPDEETSKNDLVRRFYQVGIEHVACEFSDGTFTLRHDADLIYTAVNVLRSACVSVGGAFAMALVRSHEIAVVFTSEGREQKIPLRESVMDIQLDAASKTLVVLTPTACHLFDITQILA